MRRSTRINKNQQESTKNVAQRGGPRLQRSHSDSVIDWNDYPFDDAYASETSDLPIWPMTTHSSSHPASAASPPLLYSKPLQQKPDSKKMPKKGSAPFAPSLLRKVFPPASS